MYESKLLDNSTGFCSLRCPSAAEWLPLQQDWSQRWSTVPKTYKDLYCERIGNFETRDSDVLVVTFMKAGTTWMQELAWLLLNELDYEQAKRSYVLERSMFMELSALSDHLDFDTITACQTMRNPRLLKTHLPAQLLPKELWQKQRKIIYVARNPKDVLVSLYHFKIGLATWSDDLDAFIDTFVKDNIYGAPYWEHVVDFWRMRNEPNVFFVTYEQMKHNLRGVIERLCVFLERPALSEAEMQQLLQHLTFNNMKAHKYSNLTGFIKTSHPEHKKSLEFMRRGIVGAYKDELNAAQKQKVDSWITSSLAPHGICTADIFGEF